LGRYNGEQIHEQKFDVLLEAAWRPTPAGAFPDLPEPKAQQTGLSGGGAGAAAAAAKPAAFVPRHLRGAAGACCAPPVLHVPLLGLLSCLFRFVTLQFHSEAALAFFLSLASDA
jgi:hypothetical protein